MPTDMTCANTILAQLGGNQFIRMTGSYNFGGTADSLSMALRKNKAGASHLIITLTPADLYTMEFIRVRMDPNAELGISRKVVECVEDVFNDMLQDVFERVTGLYTTLNPRRG